MLFLVRRYFMKLRFRLATTLCVLILTHFTTAAASPAPGSSLRLFTQRGYLPANEQAILDARLKVFSSNRGKAPRPSRAIDASHRSAAA